MTPTSVNQLICTARWTNGILKILDKHKSNPSITLGEIQEEFAASFAVSPALPWFYFYNQDQLLTSLLAYLCLPSEKFHDSLPHILLTDLNPKWGLQVVSVNIEVTLYELIKFLRNAVSHGNVEVDEKLVFTFSNQKSSTKSKKLEALSIHGHDLSQFCQALNYWCLTKDLLLSELVD